MIHRAALSTIYHVASCLQTITRLCLGIKQISQYYSYPNNFVLPRVAHYWIGQLQVNIRTKFKNVPTALQTERVIQLSAAQFVFRAT